MAFPLRQLLGVGLRRLTNCWTTLFACSITPRLYVFSCLWVPQENGIFDAIEKHYLRSFIFAIYLVRVEKTFAPMSRQHKISRTQKIQTSGSQGSSVFFLCLLTNCVSIIEAYTFNFEVIFSVISPGSVSHDLVSVSPHCRNRRRCPDYVTGRGPGEAHPR